MQERPEWATGHMRDTHCPNFICTMAQCAHSVSQNSSSSKLAPFFLLDHLTVMGTWSVTQMQITVTVPGTPSHQRIFCKGEPGSAWGRNGRLFRCVLEWAGIEPDLQLALCSNVPLPMSVYYIYTRCPLMPEEGVRFPRK